ncbi:MAG: tetratricopeptide repeat protein [Actinomycetota bacterium]
MALIKDRYELITLVGRGSQGEVWRAVDHQHQRNVAIKIRVFQPDSRDRLLSEARVLLDLKPHKGLPLLREDFFDDTNFFLVMEWIEGVSLKSLLPEIARDKVIGYLMQVAETLDHLHSHTPPVIHQDVKPENVLVTPDDRAILVDFGISAGHQAMGTRGYMAPEIVSSAEVIPASDIFSLAATAFHILTGLEPRPGVRPDWTKIPKTIEVALSRGLAFDPTKRPASATKLIGAMTTPKVENNLSIHASPFIGREQQLAQLLELAEKYRVLTIAGPGGMGKTRLAEELAGRLLDDFRDGVWMVELSPLRNGDLVAPTAALAAGITDEPDTEKAVRRLAKMDALLVLDNCEHLIDHCVQLCEMLVSASPNIRIITTSRTPLGIDGEVTWRIPVLTQDDSLRLFIDRASRAKVGFTLDDSNTDAVTRICEHLEGIPLALELAAARVAMMSPSDIAQRLSDRLGLLTRSRRDRRRSLRGTLDWSHDLLTEQEQRTFRRLAVFSGGFTLMAAEQISDSDIDTIGALVDKSLITFAESGHQRYDMLETVRSYANEHLDRAAETHAIRKVHLDWLCTFLETIEPSLAGPDQRELLNQIEREHDNIRTALSFALDAKDPEGLRVIGALWRFWTLRGHATEGADWASKMLTKVLTWDPHSDDRCLARAHRTAGGLALELGDHDAAKAHLEEATRMSHDLNDLRFSAALLNGLAVVAGAQGDLLTETEMYLETLRIWRSLDHKQGIATTLSNLGTSSYEQKEFGAAERYFQDSLTLRTEMKDEYGIASSLNGLGLVSHAEGDFTNAARSYEQAIGIWDRLGHKKGVGIATGNLAVTLASCGKTDEAKKRFQDAILMLGEVGAKSESAEFVREYSKLN